MVESSQTDALVETRAAARVYERGGKKIAALAATTCHVKPGDRIALIGASGSGKSTLLHLMAGLVHPTSGEVRWPALGRQETLRPGKVAIVFQSPSLMPALNAIENVELPLILGGKGARARAIAMEALDRLELGDVAARLPEELSGGRAQRIAVARAMAQCPKLLLADEPTGQLDRATGHQLIDSLLSWLAVSRTALVVATHDPTVAEQMDQVWHMDHGRLCPTSGAAR